MSVVTHVIPAQSFTDGQIINIVTPALSQPQDLVVTQSSTVVPVALNQTVQVEAKVDQEQEKQKQAIYNHPLFPLMVLMFERCEQASGSHDLVGDEGLDADIHAFIQHQEKEKKSFYSHNSELDQLMIRSIQVLRIHLLELEKVTELCKDFCTRYTNCLKGKLQSENLLRTESDYDQSMFDEPPPETSSSIQGQVHGIANTSAAPNVILGQQFHSTVSAMPTLNPGQIMSGGTVYQMVQTPQGLVAQPIQIQTSMASLATPMIHGGTPISQIGVPAAPTSTCNSATGASTNSLGSGSGFDSDDDDNGKKRTKRGVLPKSATQVMKSWLFQHIVHPYPTEDEKRQIAGQTNLTLLQVNNWFINARRRILQPMLDAGNPETSKAKKTKPQSKPPQRFWPFSSSSGDKTPTSTNTEAMVTSATTPNIAGLGQTIVLPPGAFVTPDGQIVNLQGSSMAAMLTQVKQSQSPSPTPADKDSSDNNNNSHNTDNDEHSEPEDLT